MDETAPDALWTPGHRELTESAMARFRDRVAQRHDVGEGYAGLWQWSVDHLGDFWAELWDFYGLGDHTAYDTVLTSEEMPGAHWFPGARVNFAAHVLRQGSDDAVAMVGTTERATAGAGSREVTWRELRSQVASVATALRDRGIRPGDRVVGYLPNVPEAVIAFLASAAVGAVWSSVGQDYAPGAVADRLGQLGPRLLVTGDGYCWGGAVHDRLGALPQVRAGLPSVEEVVVIPHVGDTVPADCTAWADLVATDGGGFEPEVLDVEHPLWVLFSSGTTGLPKGLVHGHGGFLLETVKQLGLHWDLREGTRFFWYTSPSWVMWNLQLSALALGVGIVCYDGSPVSPDPGVLWRVVAEHGVFFFGLSPGYLQASENAGLRPRDLVDLSHLVAMGSTGSPLSPHSHRWAYDNVGPVPLWSVSGGTDIAGGFVGGAPLVPIWPGELSVRCLGVALDSWDEAGRPLRGEVGEMVITKPMPSMPIRLWDDPGFERYREAYLSTYPGVWRQGDWVTITPRDSVVIHGRSDSTLNRNGVRMGSADIYAAVETLPEVREALVIGAEQVDGTYWMPLFVVLEDDVELDDDLVARIRTAVRDKASPRHVPDEVRVVRGIPHTRTGKKLEVPVKRILQGAELAKVANPDTIDDASLLEDYAAVRAERYPPP